MWQEVGNVVQHNPGDIMTDFEIVFIKGEIYDGKKYPLDKNLTYFLEEFTFSFLSLAI